MTESCPAPAASSRCYPRHRCPDCGRLVASPWRVDGPEAVLTQGRMRLVHRLRAHTDPATGAPCPTRSLEASPEPVCTQC